MTNRRWIAASLLGLACVLAAVPALGQRVPLPTLFSERARFAERMITVEGTVAFASAPGVGQRFTLVDGGASVDVVARAGFPVKVGDRVEVEGIYKPGPNLIDAFRVLVR